MSDQNSNVPSASTASDQKLPTVKNNKLIPQENEKPDNENPSTFPCIASQSSVPMRTEGVKKQTTIKIVSQSKDDINIGIIEGLDDTNRNVRDLNQEPIEKTTTGKIKMTLGWVSGAIGIVYVIYI